MDAVTYGLLKNKIEHGKSATDVELDKKLDKNQGTENSGKIAGIDESGDIVPMIPQGVTYNEETQCLEYGVDEKINLNVGIQLDDTLSKVGYAADAAKVGELNRELSDLEDNLVFIERSINIIDYNTVKMGYHDPTSGRYIPSTTICCIENVNVESVIGHSLVMCKDGVAISPNSYSIIITFYNDKTTQDETTFIRKVIWYLSGATVPENAKSCVIHFEFSNFGGTVESVKSWLSNVIVFDGTDNTVPQPYVKYGGIKSVKIKPNTLPKSDWNSKKWVTYGDSITAINNGSELSTGWAKYVNEYYGFVNHYGRGIGGQRFNWYNHGGCVTFVNADGEYVSNVNDKNKDNYTGTIPEGTTAIRSAFCSWDRITHMIPSSIRETIDLVFIMGGTNDIVISGDKPTEMPEASADNVFDVEWVADSTYYTGKDYNINTMEGGICSTIMKMRVWCPNAVIVLASPIFNSEKTSSGKTMFDISKRVIETGRYMSCDVVDMFSRCGIDRDNCTSWLSDGTHPYTEKGKKALGRAVIGALKTIEPLIGD